MYERGFGPTDGATQAGSIGSGSSPPLGDQLDLADSGSTTQPSNNDSKGDIGSDTQTTAADSTDSATANTDTRNINQSSEKPLVDVNSTGSGGGSGSQSATPASSGAAGGRTIHPPAPGQAPGAPNRARPQSSDGSPKDTVRSDGKVVQADDIPYNLRRSDSTLYENLGGKKENYTGHHLITIKEAQESAIMHRAAELGYDINSGPNGINLPNDLDLAKAEKLPYHPSGGAHTIKTYRGPVAGRLRQVEKDYKDGLITDDTLIETIRNVENGIFEDLMTGELRLNSRYPDIPLQENK